MGLSAIRTTSSSSLGFSRRGARVASRPFPEHFWLPRTQVYITTFSRTDNNLDSKVTFGPTLLSGWIVPLLHYVYVDRYGSCLCDQYGLCWVWQISSILRRQTLQQRIRKCLDTSERRCFFFFWKGGALSDRCGTFAAIRIRRIGGQSYVMTLRLCGVFPHNFFILQTPSFLNTPSSSSYMK